MVNLHGAISAWLTNHPTVDAARDARLALTEFDWLHSLRGSGFTTVRWHVLMLAKSAVLAHALAVTDPAKAICPSRSTQY
jgi:hypothetical protein